MFNPFAIIAAASAGKNLTPGQRAFVRLLQGLGRTALIAALPIVAQALATQTVNWQLVTLAALASGAHAVLAALSKYATAQGDAPLATAADAINAALPATPPIANLGTPPYPQNTNVAASGLTA